MILTTSIFALGGLPTGVLIAIYTGLGALLLKYVETRFAKHTEVLSDRKDYRDEIKSLNERVDTLEKKVDEYRKLYFAEQAEAAELRNQLINNGLVPDARPR